MADDFATLIVRLVAQDDASAKIDDLGKTLDRNAKKVEEFAKGFDGPRKKAAEDFAKSVLESGKVTSKALEDFASKVPIVKDSLAKAFGGSFEEVKKFADAGKLTLGTVEEAFAKIATEAGASATATVAATKAMQGGLAGLAQTAASTVAEVAGFGGEVAATAGEAAVAAARFGAVGVGLSAVTAAVVFGAKAWSDYREEQKELQATLGSGLARTLGLTVEKVEELGKATAESAGISVRSATAMVAAFAQTGKSGIVENAALLEKVAKDYAKTTGTDLPTATAALTQALIDPGKAVDELNAKFNVFDAKTTDRIKSLASQGKEFDAVKMILDGLPAALKRAEPTSIFEKAANAVSDFGGAMTKAWDNAFKSETPIQRLDRFQHELDDSKKAAEDLRRVMGEDIPAQPGGPVLRDTRAPTVASTVSRQTQGTETRSSTVAEVDGARKAKEFNDLALAAQQSAVAMGDAIRKAFHTDAPEVLRKQIEDVEKLLENVGKDSALGEAAGVQLERLKTQFEQVTKAGGAFKLEQNQEAEAFQNQIAGLRAFTDEQKAAVAQQVAYDEAIRNQRGEVKATEVGQRAYQLVMEQSARATEDVIHAQEAQLSIGPQLLAAAQQQGAARAGGIAAAQAEAQLIAQHKDITTEDSQAIIENARARAMQATEVQNVASAADFAVQIRARVASIQAETQAMGMAAVEKARYLSLSQSAIAAAQAEDQGNTALAAKIRETASALAAANTARAAAAETKIADDYSKQVDANVEAIEIEVQALNKSNAAKAQAAVYADAVRQAAKAEAEGHKELADRIIEEAGALAQAAGRKAAMSEFVSKQKHALQEAEQAWKAWARAVESELNRIGGLGFSSAGLLAGSLEDLKNISSRGSSARPGQTMGAENSLSTAVVPDKNQVANANASFGEGNYSFQAVGGSDGPGSRSSVRLVAVPDTARIAAQNEQRASAREQADAAGLSRTLSLVSSALSRAMSDLQKQMADAAEVADELRDRANDLESTADDLESKADDIDQKRQDKLNNILAAGPSPYEQNPDLFFDPNKKMLYAEQIAGNTGDLVRAQAAQARAEAHALEAQADATEEAAKQTAAGIQANIDALEEQQRQLQDLQALASAGVKLNEKEVAGLSTLINVVRSELPASIADILNRSLTATAQQTSEAFAKTNPLMTGGGVGNTGAMTGTSSQTLGVLGGAGVTNPATSFSGIGGSGTTSRLGGFADGGMVHGPGTGKSDDVLAWLSNGEFVVPAEKVAKHRSLLEAITKGGLPKFAEGGLVGDLRLPSFADGGMVDDKPLLLPTIIRVPQGPQAPQAPAHASERVKQTPAGVVIGQMTIAMPPGVDTVQYLKRSNSQVARESRRASRFIGVAH